MQEPTIAAEAAALLEQLPPDAQELWAAELKRLLPAAKMGHRQRLLLAAKELHAHQRATQRANNSHDEVDDGVLILEDNDSVISSPAESPSPAIGTKSSKKLDPPLQIPIPPASWSHADAAANFLWFEVAHFPVVMVRASPSTSATAYHQLRFGDVLAAEAVESHGGHAWARLAEPELTALQINHMRTEPTQGAAYVLLDGTHLGLGTLLRPAQPPPMGVWSLPRRLYLAAMAGRGERLSRVALPERVRYSTLLPAREAMLHPAADDSPSMAKIPAALRPVLESLQSNEYLSCWVASEALLDRTSSTTTTGDDDDGHGHHGETAAPRRTLTSVRERSLLLGTADGDDPFPPSAQHPKTRLLPQSPPPKPKLAAAMLLRGAPAACVAGWCAYHLAVGFSRLYLYFDDPSEAEAIAAAQRFAPAAEIVRCTPGFWAEQRAFNTFFDGARGTRGGDIKGSTEEVSTQNFEKGDVQSRQCVAVQHGCARAAVDGCDWILHLDVDELWYSPLDVAQRDAPAAFARCPDDVHQLIFNNLEAVPRFADPPTGGSWFTHQTLFKVHPCFTRTLEQNELAEAREERHRLQQRVKVRAREARREARRATRAGGKGGEGDDDDEDVDSSEDDEDYTKLAKRMREQCDNDEDAYCRYIGQLACEREWRLAASRVTPTDGSAKPAAPTRTEPSVDLRREWKRLHEAGNHTEAQRVAQAAKKKGGKESAAFQFFTAHMQGKAAARLRARPGAPSFAPLPAAGIHSWTIYSDGRTHKCYGAGAPVILHYPNASFEYWQTKYRMLTVAPTLGEGKQISLMTLGRMSRLLDPILTKHRAKLQKDADDEDDEKDALVAKCPWAVVVNGMHELAAAVIKRAATTGEQADKDLAEALFRHQYIVTDMLPPLASRGLLVEINLVRDVVLGELRGDVRAGSG